MAMVWLEVIKNKNKLDLCEKHRSFFDGGKYEKWLGT